MAEHKVATTSDLKPGKMCRVLAGGKEILLANVKGEFFAVDDICTHADANLSDGNLDGESVECPLHAACFNVRTGKVESDPAETDLKSYPVRIAGSDVMVEV